MDNLNNFFELSNSVFEFNYFNSNFFQCINKCFDFNSSIPISFFNDFYSNFGRPREYELESFIRFYFLKFLLRLTNDFNLILILKISIEFRSFCKFKKVPHPSQFSRFKTRFLPQIENLFNNLVNITEQICHKIDPKKSDYLLYDTTGIELPVFENNPKFVQTKIKKC